MAGTSHDSVCHACGFLGVRDLGRAIVSGLLRGKEPVQHAWWELARRGGPVHCRTADIPAESLDSPAGEEEAAVGEDLLPCRLRAAFVRDCQLWAPVLSSGALAVFEGWRVAGIRPEGPWCAPALAVPPVNMAARHCLAYGLLLAVEVAFLPEDAKAAQQCCLGVEVMGVGHRTGENLTLSFTPASGCCLMHHQNGGVQSCWSSQPVEALAADWMPGPEGLAVWVCVCPEGGVSFFRCTGTGVQAAGAVLLSDPPRWSCKVDAAEHLVRHLRRSSARVAVKSVAGTAVGCAAPVLGSKRCRRWRDSAATWTRQSRTMLCTERGPSWRGSEVQPLAIPT